MIGKARVTTARGTPVAWCEMGAGEPLVLIHGFQQSHRSWRRLAPLLAEGFRLLMPDLPGHGLSGRPNAPYTLTWYAATMAAWMDAVGLERAHLCGHSFGGGIAQWMLLEHGDKLDRLALVAPGGLGRAVCVPLRLATLPVLGRMCTPFVIRYGLPLAMRFAPQTFAGAEPEEIARAAAMNRIPGTDRAFQRSVEGVINLRGQHVQTMDHVHRVGVLPPIGLFWGAKDTILPAHQFHEAFAGVPGVTRTTYPGAGHFPHLELPQELARDLRAFLCAPVPRQRGTTIES